MSTVYRKILIALDETKGGQHVLDWVHSHHLLNVEDEIYLATAVDEDVSSVEGPGWQSAPMSGSANMSEDYGIDIRILERRGQQNLMKGIEKFRDLGYKNTKAALLKGDPEKAIIKYAKDHNTDLVICGRNHKGLFKRVVAGSVSEYLVHHLDCSLLIVK
ncbi:hypothetical protein RMATCC62417_12334 [Rhizopus microsporus]|nr:hypothetical protein RMATCC62417_12334 [Rhizopus microsporus]